jgi:MFS family permease
MHQPLRSPAPLVVPSLIKRNTALFALSQSFTGAGMQFAYGLGPLMVMALTHSAGLAGLSVALIGLSRFLVSYPVGKITDAYGRKPGILLGLALALVGTVVLGLSVSLHSVLMLVVGMLVFGMGMNASQQMRVAATDMFPPQLRAQALGYVALGSLVGLAFSPALVAGAEALAHRVGQDPLALPWLLLPVMIVGGMLVVTGVRPDPKDIGMRLEHYYPGYTPAQPSGPARRAEFRAGDMLRDVPTRLAIVCNCAAQGNMSIVMVLTSLVLHHHGHSLTAIAFSHMFHSAGMFGFTVPLGKLADRFGRNIVMFPGVATTLVGAGLVTFTPAYWSVTLGTFLVGIGWAAANVAATALIADKAPTEHRGRAIGFNDSCAGGISVVTAIITGPVIEWYGLPAAGFTAVVVAAIPLLMWPAARSRAASV